MNFTEENTRRMPPLLEPPAPGSDRWTWRFVIQAALMDDEPMLRTVLDQHHDEARLAAHEQDVTLVGEPQVKQQPLVWVEGWHKDGSRGLVAEEIARLAASDLGTKLGPVSAVQFVLSWETA